MILNSQERPSFCVQLDSKYARRCCWWSCSDPRTVRAPQCYFVRTSWKDLAKAIVLATVGHWQLGEKRSFSAKRFLMCFFDRRQMLGQFANIHAPTWSGDCDDILHRQLYVFSSKLDIHCSWNKGFHHVNHCCVLFHQKWYHVTASSLPEMLEMWAMVNEVSRGIWLREHKCRKVVVEISFCLSFTFPSFQRTGE